MIHLVLTLIATQATPKPLDIAKLLNGPKAAFEAVLGKAFKPKREPGYFFTPKGYDLIRINEFDQGMNAVVISYNDLPTAPQTLKRLGINPAKVSIKSLPNPQNAQIQMMRNRLEIRVSGLAPNSKTHKPWVLEYEQDAHGNSGRAKALKDQIQAATGAKKLALIQSCYDWRTKILLDSR